MTLLRHRGSLNLLPGKFLNIVQFMSGQKILGKRGADEVAEETSSSVVKREKTVNASAKTKQTKLDFGKVKSSTSDKVALGKTSAMESSDSSDSEHLKEVAERLERLRHNAKSNAKSEETKDAPLLGTSSAIHAASKEPDDLKPEPARASAWEEHGQLLMYTRKGVMASSKVSHYMLTFTAEDTFLKIHFQLILSCKSLSMKIVSFQCS